MLVLTTEYFAWKRNKKKKEEESYVGLDTNITRMPMFTVTPAVANILRFYLTILDCNPS